MAWGSSVPAALTGLATVLGAAAPGVKVQKFPNVGASSRGEVITLAHQSDMSAGVHNAVHLGDVGLRAQQEEYTVNGCIQVLRGGTVMEPVIDRAFELLAVIGGALTADQTLGQAIQGAARLGEWQLKTQQSKQGAYAEIEFSVEVTAFTTR